MATTEEKITILANDARETREAVIRMEGKLDLVMSKMNDHAEQLDDHEERLRELEKKRWPLQEIGIILSLLAVVAAIVIPFLI